MFVDDFKREWGPFKKWLESHGSEVLAVTNEYEVARFITCCGIGIVYRNASGKISSWTNGALEAYLAWKNNTTYKVNPKVKRESRGATRRRILVNSIVERDGWNCIYCNKLLTTETATIEHIVPIARSGFENLANLAIACKECNQIVGYMTVKQKLDYAISLRKGKCDDREGCCL